MARQAAHLSETAIDKIQRGKKVTDGQVKGLVIERLTDGRYFWRLRFKKNEKWTMRSLGERPPVSLQAARSLATQCLAALETGASVDRVLSENGIGNASHMVEEAVDQLGTRFGTAFESWMEHMSHQWAPKNYDLILKRMQIDVLPYWSDRPIKDITELEAIQLLKRVWSRAADTSHRLFTNLKEMWRWARKQGLVTENVFTDIKPGKDIGPVHREHMDAITDERELGLFLNAVENYTGSFIVRAALTLSAHCFVRSSELRLARWEEFDLPNATWLIPAKRMKMKVDHIVPLSRQVLSVLRQLKDCTDDGLVFPSGYVKDQPISNNIFSVVIHRLGFKATQHGFRATFRTLADERLRMPIDIIEHQLAHKVKDTLGRAYNRTQKLEERREMMSRWSDYLDRLKAEHN